METLLVFIDLKHYLDVFGRCKEMYSKNLNVVVLYCLTNAITIKAVHTNIKFIYFTTKNIKMKRNNKHV